MKRLDPEILHAFADGELEPEVAARVVMHLADCPADQVVVDGIMAMNATLARACEGPLHQPVPPAIREAIFGPPVVTGAATAGSAGLPGVSRRAARLAAGWWAAGGAALAAAVAVAAILLPLADSPTLTLGPVEQRSPIAEALGELASGQTRLVARNTELAIVASFAVEGGYCREFTLRNDTERDLAALACNDAGGWTVAARHEAPAFKPNSGYVPAGGNDDDPIGAQLNARGAGMVLTPAEEAAARNAGWR